MKNLTRSSNLSWMLVRSFLGPLPAQARHAPRSGRAPERRAGQPAEVQERDREAHELREGRALRGRPEHLPMLFLTLR